MKLKATILLISTLFIVNTAFAEYSFVDPNDFTGESFFTPAGSGTKTEKPSNEQASDAQKTEDNKRETTPPIKKLRLSVQAWKQERQAKKSELAPTDPNASIYNKETDTSDFASKEVEEEFDENMMPDGFEADEEAVEENKKAKHWFKGKNDVSEKAEDTENIVLDCDNMDYDTENYCLYATGNVNVEFVKQQTTVKADKITYDRMNNTIKAEGNVKIVKNGQIIDGDYIFVYMNEESALIENPITRTATIEIKAKKGYVYGDKITQEQGSITVDHSYPIVLRSPGGPQIQRMMVPKEATLKNDMENGLVKVKAKEITIKQKGDLEVIAIRHTNVKKGKWTILKVPALKVYTNKNHDYAETNSWELGSYKGLGMFIGGGFVFELPKGSVLKAMPILTYHHKIGVGAMGRFHSGTNFTQAAYGTSQSKILVYGKQRLDDNLYLQYGMNDYMEEWFLGRRRPKYGVDLVYDKSYSSSDFLLKGRTSAYRHRLDVGYYQDMGFDKYYDKIRSSNVGTLRARYMAEASQNFYRYRNEANQTELSFDAVAQLSAALYGTGDTQFIGRVGPRMHSQWKRWMQDIGYFQSVYDDNTPMPVFDAYRYGKSNVYAREYIRLCKYLTLAWFGSINLSNDAGNGKLFQENRFFLSIGPDDIKFNIGYDTIREGTFFNVLIMTDAKGTQVDYDKLVIKQDKKPQDEKENKEPAKPKAEFQNSNKAPVLQYAQVEDIKAVEDVL